MSDTALPPEHADRLAPLGEPLAAFQPGAAQSVGRVLAAVFMLVLGLALIGLTIAAFFFARTFNGVHALIGGVALLGASITAWRRLRQSRGLRVFVFPDALARVQGETATVIPWKDIAAVRRASLNSSERANAASAAVKLTLETSDGRLLELDDSLADLRRLRELVEERTLEHMLHPALDAYEAGEEVGFGRLRLSRDGVCYGRGVLPWTNYEGAEAARGEVIVRARDARRPFCKVLTRDVPNVHVLIALAEYVRKYAS